MLGFLHPTEQAKTMIIQGTDNSRRTCFLLLLTLLGLIFHLLFSYLGAQNSWTCELDNLNPKHDYICKQLRNQASCRTLSGPLKAQILLNINNQVKASAFIVCPWQIAISQLRVCFIIGSILIVLMGLTSLAKQDKQLAEVATNAGYFFCLLLGISASFDWYGISQSITNNYALCTLTDEFTVTQGVSGQRLDCTHSLFNVMVYIGYSLTLLMGVTAYNLDQWKKNLTIDEFNQGLWWNLQEFRNYLNKRIVYSSYSGIQRPQCYQSHYKFIDVEI